ncbi:MAG: hypothetical protein GY833_23020 [Aestuariibacter sp.]|nr:hypothetical protein [Aestuariibacter sp.]
MTELTANQLVLLLDVFGGDRVASQDSLQPLKEKGLVERIYSAGDGTYGAYVTPRGYKQLRERLIDHANSLERLHAVLGGSQAASLVDSAVN